jgi:hypothetical protein
MTGDWLNDDRAIVLDDKAQAIAGVDAEMLPNSLWDRDLALGGQRRGRHGILLTFLAYITLM